MIGDSYLNPILRQLSSVRAAGLSIVILPTTMFDVWLYNGCMMKERVKSTGKHRESTFHNFRSNITLVVTIRKNTSASSFEKVFRFQEWWTKNEWFVIKPSQEKCVIVWSQTTRFVSASLATWSPSHNHEHVCSFDCERICTLFTKSPVTG